MTNTVTNPKKINPGTYMSWSDRVGLGRGLGVRQVRLLSFLHAPTCARLNRQTERLPNLTLLNPTPREGM